jgi:hypothetical protein
MTGLGAPIHFLASVSGVTVTAPGCNYVETIPEEEEPELDFSKVLWEILSRNAYIELRIQ